MAILPRRAQTAVTFKLGLLYHFNHPRTTKSPSGWQHENEANLVWPHVTVSIPVSIQCVVTPQRQSPAEPAQRRADPPGLVPAPEPAPRLADPVPGAVEPTTEPRRTPLGQQAVPGPE